MLYPIRRSSEVRRKPHWDSDQYTLFKIIDTQLYLSFKPNTTSQDQVLQGMENCIEKIRKWMIHDRLLINDSKTVLILIGSKQQLSKLQPISISVGNSYNGQFGCGICKHPGRYDQQTRGRLYEYRPSGTVAVRTAQETRMFARVEEARGTTVFVPICKTCVEKAQVLLYNFGRISPSLHVLHHGLLALTSILCLKNSLLKLKICTLEQGDPSANGGETRKTNFNLYHLGKGKAGWDSVNHSGQ
ncbi:hypothetical protein pdam_00018115, partial [Pocillopora damicornis]